ncbi:MAG: outer membrane beta-barrel protein [Bacteroidetes bacterium]|nr:outer membrane beta-barrel protein [Bacteroidota bacterium]
MKKVFLTISFLLICGIVVFTANPVFSNDKVHGSNDQLFFTDSIINMHGMKIQRIGDDSMIIYLHKKDFKHIGKHWNCFSKGKYNGHWAGFGIGLNGYVNSDFNMDFPVSEKYLELNTARSLSVYLNPIEFNVNLAKNHLGFTSGLGFELNNYFFTGNDVLTGDSTKLTTYKIVDRNGNPVDLQRNKLFVAWITVPLLFEYQTNAGTRLNSFHLGVGVIGKARIGSYTKQVFDDREKEETYYLLTQGGRPVGSFDVEKCYTRTHNPYHLTPFNVDATVRIGWSILNLYATYSILPMFTENHGPQVYPWTVGISLIGW